MVTPGFAFVLSNLIQTQTKDRARGIPFTYAYNENVHGKLFNRQCMVSMM